MTEEKIPSMEDIDNENFDLDGQEESAPSEAPQEEPEQVTEPEQPEAEPEPKKDRVQERINQLTAKYREEERKRQELEERLKAVEQPQPAAPKVPRLEDFDYDDSQYQQALLKYQEHLIDVKVTQRTQEIIQQQRQSAHEERQRTKAESFGKKVEAANIKGYQEAIESLVNYAPLRPELVDAIQEDDNGPHLVHYLGTHLDVADRIAQIRNPAIAALELGKISAGLKHKPNKQITKATRPIEPEARSGGKLKKDEADMSMDEIMSLPYK